MKTAQAAGLASVGQVVSLLVLLTSPVVASEPYRATIEAKLPIYPKVVGAALDSEFFGRPVILLTTARGDAGRAFAYRLETQPLQIVDTLLSDSTKDLRRALLAQLDSDPGPDYLVAGDSAARVLLSGSPGTEPVLQVPGRILSLAASSTGGSVWIGYNKDSSWNDPWYMQRHVSAGGLSYFPTIFSGGENILPFHAAEALRWQDGDADGQPELMVLWYSEGGASEFGPGTPHTSDWDIWSYGFGLVTDTPSVSISSTVASLTLRGDGYYGYLVLAGSLLLADGISARGPVCATASSASGWTIQGGNFYRAAIQCKLLLPDSVLWSHPGTYGRPFAWDIDGDGVQEIVATHVDRNVPSRNVIFDPGTGDSLGIVESEYSLSPWATATFPDGRPRGFLLVNDTIIMFSISTGSKGSDAFLPTVIALRSNYPNPFNAGTVIEFTTNRSSEARVTVFDVLGRPVVDLATTAVTAGKHRARWDGNNRDGTPAPSGAYFYRVSQNDQFATGKMLLLR